MKRLNFNLFAGILFLAFTTACSGGKNMKYPLTVETPFVMLAKTTTIHIAKMELTDTATVLSIHAVFKPHNWIRIAKECKLVTDMGTELPVISSDGIQLGEKFWMPDSGKTDFTLKFGPMPADAKYFDFIECKEEGCFDLFGVYFSSERPHLKIPAEWKKVRYPENDTLPTSVFSEDSAVVEGHILGYRPEMELSAGLYYSKIGRSKYSTVPVKENGDFKIAVCPYLSCKSYLFLKGHIYSVILVPGEKTSILVDLSRTSEKHYIPEYRGYLAATGHEVADRTGKGILAEEMFRYETMEGKNARDVVSYLNERLKEVCDSIDGIKAGKSYKQIVKMDVETEYLKIRFDFEQYWEDRVLNDESVDSKESLDLFLDSLGTNVPSLDCLNVPYFSLEEDIFELYNLNKRHFPEIANCNNDNLFNSRLLLLKLDNWIPLSLEEIKELDSFENPAFKNFVREKTAERDAMVKVLKENKRVHYEELDDVAPAKILGTILERYKGKAVLFDLWTTWCGPCCAAHKVMSPLKEELKNEDIVFVYITNGSSNLEKWNEMIPEISGEHYSLTDEQWNAVFAKYKSGYIPTYLLFNKKGKFVYEKIGYPDLEIMKSELLKALGK